MSSSMDSVRLAEVHCAMARLGEYVETRYGLAPYIVTEELKEDLSVVLEALKDRLDREAAQ